MVRKKPLAPPGDPRQSILAAAAEEFSERGFAGARVDAIAERAGVNKAMLYYYVGDKAALYEQVILDAVGTVTAHLERGLSGETTPEGRLLAIARAFEAAATEKPHLPKIMLREMAMGGRDLPAPAIEAFARIIGLEASILEDAARTGRFNAINPMTLHILIVGGTMLHMVSRGVRERIRGVAQPGLPEPEGSPSEAVSGLLLQGLLARPAGAPREGARPRTAQTSPHHGTSRGRQALEKKEKRT